MLDDLTRSSEVLVGMIESSKAQSEIIIDKISGIFSIINKRGTLKRANWNLAKLLNVEFEYLINYSLADLFSPEQWHEFLLKMDNLENQIKQNPKKKDIELSFNLSFNHEIGKSYNWVISAFNYPRSDEERLYVVNGTYIGELLTIQKELEVLNKGLEQTVDERTRDLKETHDRLIRVAHSAGMAEIAANILHKVGNTLVSIQLPSYKVKKCFPEKQLKSFKKLLDLINQDPKTEYLGKLSLFNDFFTEEKAKLNDAVDKIEKNLHVMQGILKDQEDYTRVEALIETIDLRSLLNITTEMLEKIQDINGINFERKFDEPIIMKAERNKLLNIFMNLLKNSVEAIHDKSEKYIRITAKLDEANKNVSIFVEDNGPSIPKEDHYKAFNFGYSTKKGHDGMGMHTVGLLIEEMNGKISLEDSDLGGLKVILVIPQDLEEKTK